MHTTGRGVGHRLTNTAGCRRCCQVPPPVVNIATRARETALPVQMFVSLLGNDFTRLLQGCQAVQVHTGRALASRGTTAHVPTEGTAPETSSIQELLLCSLRAACRCLERGGGAMRSPHVTQATGLHRLRRPRACARTASTTVGTCCRGLLRAFRCWKAVITPHELANQPRTTWRRSA